MRILVSAAALVTLLAFGACASTTGEEGPETGAPLMPVTALAQRLGLSVSGSDAGHVTLKGPGNTVTIFAPPARYVYVNGKPLGPVSGVTRIRGVFHVPAGFEARIRAALSAAPPARVVRAPPPAAPVKPPAPAAPALADVRVVLDAGHGGKDPGARSAIGTWEKVLNLLVARRIADALAARGAKVTLTRSGDSFVELEERAAVANRAAAHLFVSIHADSSPSPATRGFTVYVSRSASNETWRIARIIAAALAGQGVPSRGLKQADYRVLVKTKMPAVLVEIGYLSNSTEATWLMKDASVELLR